LAELFKDSNNKKSIKPYLIKNHLTSRGLAYWFMDDGGKLDYNKNTTNKSLVLNTHSFAHYEVIIACSELNTKFNLNCSIKQNKRKSIIVISSESFNTFFNLVDPFIIYSMRYKLTFS
jgi:hypothetical protein